MNVKNSRYRLESFALGFLRFGLFGLIAAVGIVLSVQSFAAPSSAASAAPAKAYFGLLPGISTLLNATAGSTTKSTNFNLGLNAGMKFIPELAVGGFFNWIPVSSETSIEGVSAKNLMYGAEISYCFGESLEGLQLGVKAGALTSSDSATVLGLSVDVSSTRFIFGPKVSYDYMVADFVSVGAQLDFIVGLQKDLETKNPLFLNSMAAVKFWLQ